MSLKDLVSKRILDDILGPLFKLGEWRVLVLDQLSTSIVSSCCRMHDVMSKGITLVEGLEKSKEPQLAREAIYIMWPSEESLTKMLMDFDESFRVYKAAHVFLLDRLPPVLVTKLQQSPAKKYIRSLKESYIGFLPKESRVFTLNFPDSFRLFFSPGSAGKGEMKTRIADQLATLCAFLGEFPTIRCNKAVAGVEDIAHELYKRLEDFKMQSPSFATDEGKNKSELIILDRGFDVVSPLVHELTYQAMVYDLLGIKRDVYSYEATTEGGGKHSREVILDESDPLWVELRHKFISDVIGEVREMVKGFADSKSKSPTASYDMSVKKLHQMIKEVPQYQKELSKLARHFSLAETCDKKLKAGMFDLCKAEQDLATGESETGEKIDSAMNLTTPILFDRKIGVYEKVRLMMLQLLFSEGEAKEGFAKLIQRVEIPPKERSSILNLACLGHPSVEGREGRGNGIEEQSQRAEEEGEGRRREIRRLSLDTHHSRHHGVCHRGEAGYELLSRAVTASWLLASFLHLHPPRPSRSECPQ
ncbi:Syntaxin-binding protein 1 [Geodia barretti]|uniref:Syntaxin-binding protein 1 n=2 Tax=Geodia barretti TaxID=519541 RepID=A0AA35TJ01_GEOBA|nr:Syntaxin-binding protein 1 [Geodia barretti]